METITKKITEIQPSQLYISAQKMNKVEKYLDSSVREELEPLPVKKIGNQLFFTDGHTRALVLYKKGIEKINIYWDQDKLNWLQYLVCVDWCQQSGINDISDLETRILGHKKYKKLWLDKCVRMQKKAEEDRFNFINFKEVNEPDTKSDICYKIINNLPDWFGREESNQEYSRGVRNDYFIAARIGDIPIGFISIKDHNQFTAEIYVLGILKEFHQLGIGKRFMQLVEGELLKSDKKFLTVKTLSGSNPDPYYNKTRKFYKAMGFYPLEEMPELWSEEEPCLYMVKPI